MECNTFWQEKGFETLEILRCLVWNYKLVAIDLSLRTFQQSGIVGERSIHLLAPFWLFSSAVLSLKFCWAEERFGFDLHYCCSSLHKYMVDSVSYFVYRKEEENYDALRDIMDDAR